MTDLSIQFAKAYCEYIEWEYLSFEDFGRRLCENYFYNPNRQHDSNFREMVRGWMWGNSGDVQKATVEHYLFFKKIDSIYEIVAKENGWTES